MAGSQQQSATGKPPPHRQQACRVGQIEDHVQMTTPARFDLRLGLTELVVLLNSRQAIESGKVVVIAQRLRLLTASREDTWRYRSQVCLAIDG